MVFSDSQALTNQCRIRLIITLLFKLKLWSECVMSSLICYVVVELYNFRQVSGRLNVGCNVNH